LWIGTVDRGLLHYYHGKTDTFNRSAGLMNDDARYIFEDHEGTIWTITSGGLDRFRAFAVPRFTTEQVLSTGSANSLITARDGSLWLSSLNGLNRWKNGKITVYRGQTWSSDGSADASNEVVDRGLASNAIQSLYDDSRDRVWVTTPRGLS